MAKLQVRAETIVDVRLEGYAPMLFDRFSGDLKRELLPEEKIYTDSKGNLVFPVLNLAAFLSSKYGDTATAEECGRLRNTVGGAIMSYTTFAPMPDIPLTRKGKQLTTKNAGIKIVHHVAKVFSGKQQVPNPKKRPMLDTPWELSFKLTLIENPVVDTELLKRIFITGGHAIGLGTYRRMYGKFHVTKWDSR